MDHLTDIADANLAALAQILDDLDGAVEGTRTRSGDLPATPEQAAARLSLFHAEQDEREAHQWRVLAARSRGGTVLPLTAPNGPGKTPISPGASDARATVIFGLLELDEAVSESLGWKARRIASPRQRITRLRAMLDAVADRADLAEHVVSESSRLLNTAQAAIDPAPRLYVGRCPDCSAATLQVDLDQDVIICTNRACICGVEDCRCRSGRRHIWQRPQWDFLAQRMRSA